MSAKTRYQRLRTPSSIASLFLVLVVLGCWPTEAQRPLEPETARTGRWQAAARQLADYGVASDVESLLVALTSHPDSSVRIKAALILGERGDTEALPVLRQKLSDPSPRVRRQAASALGHLGDEEGLEILVGMMQSSEELEERISIAFHLVQLSDFRGYRHLIEGASAQEPWIRLQVASYLPYFFAMPERAPDLDTPMELLIQLLRDSDAMIRRRVVSSFGLTSLYGGPTEELLRKAEELEVYDLDEDVREAARLVQYSLRDEATRSSKRGVPP